MLRLSVPHLDDAAIDACNRVLRSGMLVHGSEGQAFERELQDWLRVPHALVVSSGTAALHMALMALEIGPGDAVLIPDFSFPATGNAVLMTGATPVLIDVEPGTYCLDVARVAERLATWDLEQRPRAILPVHEFGHPVGMKALMNMAREHGLAIVEDAACAIGADCDGQAAGTVGDVGCFSLHPRKTLTTGEGGIVVTRSDSLATKLRRLRNHGMERLPEGMVFMEAGLNYRLTDFQSAMGRTQLPHLSGWIQARKALARAYRSALSGLETQGHLQCPEDHAGHSWQTFMVVLDEQHDRPTVLRALAERGIEANLGAQAMSLQPSFKHAPGADRTPHAQRLFRQGLALPFCEAYDVAVIEQVVGALSTILNSGVSRV